jgi:alkylation response protein AidB-like acyl-CoA dehydrogenase
MYFGLSEEQKSLKESISKYLEANAPLEAIKAVADGEKEKAKAIHQGLVDLGISGLMVPEQYGGLELDTLFAAVVAGALGAGTAPSPFTGAYVMAPIALSLAGSDTQKDYWLPKIAGGEVVIGMGLSEYVGAREDAGVTFSDGKISGRSLFVIDGKDADAFILANSSGQLFLVDAKSAGIEVVDLITVDKTRDSIELILKDVSAELLPGSEKDPSAINKVIDTGRLMLSADTVGASQIMLDKSVAYSLERKQFGRAIGSFQAVKHMCAEMTAELEPCHSMVWHAAHCQDNIKEEAREMACHLKAHVAEVGQQVAKTSIEVHGGMGFTDEMGLHYWFKRIGLNRQLLGSPELVREEVAKLQGFDQSLVKKKVTKSVASDRLTGRRNLMDSGSSNELPELFN